jgi:hypothetical protein
MAIPYPDWLPLAQRSSKNMTFQDGFRTDVPAVGNPIFQRLTDDITTTWSLTWIFTLQQERAFQLWLRSPDYLDNCNEWFTMRIDIGGSGVQEQELHFTAWPVQSSIDGGIVTWSGTVVCRELKNTDDEYADMIIELGPEWASIVDEVVNIDMPIYPYAAPLDMVVTDANAT